MKTEKEKMLAGELYNASDAQLTAERIKARLLTKKLNDSRKDEEDLQASIIKELIPNAGPGIWIEAPFYCDYGSNIITGEKVFFNFNCVILDVMKVTIGSRTMFGQNVQISTATHHIDSIERSYGLEFAKSITIGEDVWVDGSSVSSEDQRVG